LYLDPPLGAVVISVDEKSGIQALEGRLPGRVIPGDHCVVKVHHG
jgi:hypothetical protein